MDDPRSVREGTQTLAPRSRPGRLVGVLAAAGAVWALLPATAGSAREEPLRACAEGRAPCGEALCAALPARCQDTCTGAACLADAVCAAVASRCALAPAGSCAWKATPEFPRPCGEPARCAPTERDPTAGGALRQHWVRNPLAAVAAGQERWKGETGFEGSASVREPASTLTLASSRPPGGTAGDGGEPAGGTGSGAPSGRDIVGPLGSLLDPASVGSGVPGGIGVLGPPGDPDPNVLHPCDNPGSGCGLSLPRLGPVSTGSSGPEPAGVVETPAKPFELPSGGGPR